MVKMKIISETTEKLSFDPLWPKKFTRVDPPTPATRMRYAENMLKKTKITFPKTQPSSGQLHRARHEKHTRKKKKTKNRPKSTTLRA